jgi:WD40 repeat protein
MQGMARIRIFYLIIAISWVLPGTAAAGPKPDTNMPEESPKAQVQILQDTNPPWNQIAREISGKPTLCLDPQGHYATVREVIFTPDDKYLITASRDKTIRVWDLSTGRTVKTIRGQIGWGSLGKIYAAALSPDGRTLAVSGFLREPDRKSHVIRIHDLETGEIIKLLKGHTQPVCDLDFSPDGRYIASGGFDEAVRIWDVEAGQEVLKLQEPTDTIYSVQFSPHGTHVAAANDDKNIYLWRLSDGKLIKRMSGHKDRVRAVDFTPDGRHIISAGYDKRINLWNATTGEFIKTLAVQDLRPRTLAISPDGTKMATTTFSEPYDCTVFDIASGRVITVFKRHNNSSLSVCFSNDSKYIASSGGDTNPTFVWEPESGEVVQQLQGIGRWVFAVAFSSDGSKLAIGQTNVFNGRFDRGPLERIIRLKDGNDWHVSFGGKVVDPREFIRCTGTHGSYRLKAEKGGEFNAGSALLTMLKNGKPLYKIERDSATGYEHRVYTFTPKGDAFISGGNHGHLRAYDAETGEALTHFIGHETTVWAIAISEDGRYLASGSTDQTVRIWDLTAMRNNPLTYPLVSIFMADNDEFVAWTPDGYYTCSLKGDRYFGWHVNKGSEYQADFYPAERFIERFYRPDIIASTLAGNAPTTDFMETPGTEKVEPPLEIEKILPPKPFFLQPAQNFLETTEPTIDIRAGAKSISDEPIRSLKLMINGQPVASETGRGMDTILQSKVELSPGENVITLIADSASARSNPVEIKVVRKGETKQKDLYKPELYVLSIGVSEYLDPRMNLNLAHIDAQSVADFFKNQEDKLYKKVHLKLLVNDEATRDNILDGMDWLLQEATQRDVAILFVAGHGMNDDRGSYYFLGHDAEIDRLRRTGVEWFHFKDILTALPSKTILLADTCHSGFITGSHRRSVNDMTSALKDLVAAGTGIVVMSAATGLEASKENADWGHGAFTKALLEGLKGEADYDKNKTVDIKEIDLFVTHRVKELTKGTQHPATEIPSSLPNFPIVAR